MLKDKTFIQVKYRRQSEKTLSIGGHGAGMHSYMDIISEKEKIRRLTPIECERLQGFPDNWTAGFSDTQRYKMMGNAVTVNVITAILTKLNSSPSNPPSQN